MMLHDSTSKVCNMVRNISMPQQEILVLLQIPHQRSWMMQSFHKTFSCLCKLLMPRVLGGCRDTVFHSWILG